MEAQKSREREAHSVASVHLKRGQVIHVEGPKWVQVQ